MAVATIHEQRAESVPYAKPSEYDVLVLFCREEIGRAGDCSWRLILRVNLSFPFCLHLGICSGVVPLFFVGNLFQSIELLSVEFVQFRIDIYNSLFSNGSMRRCTNSTYT